MRLFFRTVNIATKFRFIYTRMFVTAHWLSSNEYIYIYISMGALVWANFITKCCAYFGTHFISSISMLCFVLREFISIQYSLSFCLIFRFCLDLISNRAWFHMDKWIKCEDWRDVKWCFIYNFFWYHQLINAINVHVLWLFSFIYQ